MLTAFYNHKGGVAKTTLATHTFRILAASGRPCAFYDADPQRDGLALLAAHGHEAIEAGEAWYTDPEAGEDRGSGAPTGALVTTDLDAALAYEHVVVDAPPRGDFLRRMAEHAVPDLVVAPVCGRLAVEGAAHVADEAARYGARVVVVFTMTDQRAPFSRVEAAAVRKLGVEVFPLAIPRSDAVRKAELRGVAVWALPHAGRAPAGRALRALCEWVASGAEPGAVLVPRRRSERGLRRRRDLWGR
jgi:cellulose biosynthesis protein BcsQ